MWCGESVCGIFDRTVGRGEIRMGALREGRWIFEIGFTQLRACAWVRVLHVIVLTHLRAWGVVRVLKICFARVSASCFFFFGLRRGLRSTSEGLCVRVLHLFLFLVFYGTSSSSLYFCDGVNKATMMIVTPASCAWFLNGSHARGRGQLPSPPRGTSSVQKE